MRSLMREAGLAVARAGMQLNRGDGDINKYQLFILYLLRNTCWLRVGLMGNCRSEMDRLGCFLVSVKFKLLKNSAV